MPRTTVSGRLVTVDGQVGENKNGEFIQFTNYSFEVVSAISSPPGIYTQLDGFLYKIKVIHGDERECFVTNEDASTLQSFTKAASRTLKGVQQVRCKDTLWSRYIFQQCSSFRASSSFKSRTLVSALGLQPNSDVWVLGPETQINSKGELLDKDDLPFYWYEDYVIKRDAVDDQRLVPLPIALPLQTQGIQNLLKAAKECLRDNFQSFFQVLSGMCMAMHFEELIALQAECPMVLAYSETPGTGKTTSLRAALSLCGAAVVHFRVGKSSPTSLVSRAAITTIPIGVDDINSQNSIETLSVQFFNGAALSTVSSGNNTPRTSLLFTSNKAFAESSRNAARLIHIPFFKGAVELSQREKEDALKIACQHASSSIGILISIGDKLKATHFQTHISKDLLPLVCAALPEVDFRVQKSYALLLGIGEELCNSISLPEVIAFPEITQFFVQKWAPEVASLLKPTQSSLQSALNQILDDIEDLETCEILRFLRPQVANKLNPARLSVAIYLPLLKCHCTGLDEAKFKRNIKEVGGNIKASLPFLREGCSDRVLKPSENGRQRKCITIPHSAIAQDIIQMLVERVSESSITPKAEHPRSSTPTPYEDLRQLSELCEDDKTPSPIMQDELLPPFQNSYDDDNHTEISQAHSSFSSLSEPLFGASLDLRDKTISPIGSISSVSESLFGKSTERSVSPIRCLNTTYIISSEEVDNTPLHDPAETKPPPMQATPVSPPSTKKIPDQITEVADLTTFVSLKPDSKAIIKPIQRIETSTGKLEQQHQSVSLLRTIDKEASIDGCILRIKQKTQMLLEAKIGSYKIFDNGILSLIDDNGWVTDEVITSFMLAATRKSNKEGKVYVMDVSAVNDICNGMYIHRQKVLSRVDVSQYNALIGAYCFEKKHWILVIVEPLQRRILYIDPAMNTPQKVLDRIRKQWNQYSIHQLNGGYWLQKFTWEVTSIPHSFQEDNSSCGVYVMKFAQQYLDGSSLSLDANSVSDTRIEMAKMILSNSDDISEYCRTCSSKARKKCIWIGCDNCSSWYHLDCVNRKIKSKLEAANIQSVDFVGPCCSKDSFYVVKEKY